MPEALVASCSHGTGRMMPRGAARWQLSVEQHVQTTAHVECRKDPEVLDETPAAYEPIDAVMQAQTDLVEIEHTLQEVVCAKG